MITITRRRKLVNIHSHNLPIMQDNTVLQPPTPPCNKAILPLLRDVVVMCFYRICFMNSRIIWEPRINYSSNMADSAMSSEIKANISYISCAYIA